MNTYDDLVAVGNDEQERMNFVFSAIRNYKCSKEYTDITVAEQYAKQKNVTIEMYQKMLRTVSGKLVPDVYTANHKCKSHFYKYFILQEVSYLLKNGISFENEKTYDKLGKNFNTQTFIAVKHALEMGVCYGFYNLNQIVYFKATEFVPLFDEEDGLMKAGIRFTQIDRHKPLTATLYELDGYTVYTNDEKGNIKVKKEKRPYILHITSTIADGETEVIGENYKTFPIVPLYGNLDHQTELEGKREQIDCYDLIKSGFANDIDDASMIYWTLQGSGGMDDVDLAKFIERMKILKAAVIDDDMQAVAHTMDVPYQGRQVYLQILKDDLFDAFMGVDVKKIASGHVTTTEIESSYEPLDEKATGLMICINDFLERIFFIAGIEDVPHYNPSRIINKREETEIILMAAEYLDEETILEKLPFLTDAEVEEILKKKLEEEAARYRVEQETEEDEEGEEEE